MNLNDFSKKTLSEIFNECDISSLRTISDEDGNVIKIMIEYKPKEISHERNI